MKSSAFINGNIITMRDDYPSAQSVLVTDGIIEKVGTTDDILKLAAPGCAIIDLDGKTLLPGFIDGHSHFTAAYLFPRFSPPPVGDIDSINKLLEKIKSEIIANPPKKNKWFFGMGYDNVYFENNRHPTCFELDSVSKDIPILVMHISGHLGVANSRALELMKITRDTVAPVGGVIGHFDNGEPNGLLEEAALMGNLKKAGLGLLPPLSEIIKRVCNGQNTYASFGYTTVQDGGVAAPQMLLLKYLAHKKKLLLDVCTYKTVVVGKKIKTDKTYHRHLRVCGAKAFLDGSPQGKTAWLSKPYYVVPEGKPADFCGYPSHTDDEAFSIFDFCIANKLQTLVHCNGDAACEQFIVQYGKALKKHGSPDLRPVMIHCQTVRDDQLDRMKKLGILPTFFHDHVYFWGDYHRDSVLGEERAQRISPLMSAVKRDMTFTFHSDTPVTAPDAIFTLHNAVNRVTSSGKPLGQQYAVDTNTALKALTIWAAYQYGEENIKGTVEEDKYADFVILDRNPLETDNDKLKDIKVVATVKEGEFVYRD